MWGYDWSSDSLEVQIEQNRGSALPAVAQAGVMRWPLLPSLHPRRSSQDPVATGVEPGFAPAQSSVEKQCILCVHVLQFMI